jgi:hypothetical protein
VGDASNVLTRNPMQKMMLWITLFHGDNNAAA